MATTSFPERGESAQPPVELTNGSIAEPPTSAAGLTAVVSSMQHVAAQMGVLRGARALALLNQKGGIDCMSCAWPDPDGERSAAEFCENGAKALAWEGDTRRLTAEFFRRHSVAELSRQSDYELGRQGRLTEPLVLRPDATHYEPITWDAAFRLLAEELNSLASPNQAIFYTSGRTSNEAAFLYQLFVRQFGTNNLPDCSNMCHESSGAALASTIGIGKGTVTLDDFPRADVIFILGQNPGTNHPRMLTSLQEAKRRGAKILSANPLREPGLLAFKHPQEVRGMLGFSTPLTDLYLQVRINGDAALLQGIMKHLLEADDRRAGSGIDRAFVAANTVGFAELAAHLRRVEWSAIEQQSGLTEKAIREAGEMLRSTNKIIACWAMGLTQHPNAVATIRDVVNLLLLRGAIGRPGAGACPVRGHSNVQGDRTMGIWEKPKPAFLDALERVFGFAPPREAGFDTVDSIKAMYEGRAHVFFGLGGNFLSATPDTEYTATALRRCRLTAHVSTKLHRGHLVAGRIGLILPCLGRTEIDRQSSGPQFVTCENSMGVVQTSEGRLEPASPNLLSEPAIVARLATAVLGSRSSVDWLGLSANYDRIRDLIERVIPGFEDYNRRVRRPGGFYLPNGPRSGRFTTADGKAHFSTNPFPETKLGDNELLMMTIRTHDQFNTTIYGLDDRYRGVFHERRVIFLHRDDIRKRGLRAGDRVDLHSHYRGRTRTAELFLVVPYDIPPGCAATYFPETNVLVPIDSVADESNTPTSKYIVITLTRHA